MNNFIKVPKNKILRKIQEWIILRKLRDKLKEQSKCNVIIINDFFKIKQKFKIFCGFLWDHQIITNKEKKEECVICKKILNN